MASKWESIKDPVARERLVQLDELYDRFAQAQDRSRPSDLLSVENIAQTEMNAWSKLAALREPPTHLRFSAAHPSSQFKEQIAVLLGAYGTLLDSRAERSETRQK
jgi:hypothetical protein